MTQATEVISREDRNRAIRESARKGQPFSFGHFGYTPSERTLRCGEDKVLKFTLMEAALFLDIAQGDGQDGPTTKKTLFNTLRMARSQAKHIKVVDQKLHRLRRALEDFVSGSSRHIVTVLGGYMLADDPRGKAPRHIRIRKPHPPTD